MIRRRRILKRETRRAVTKTANRSLKSNSSNNRVRNRPAKTEISRVQRRPTPAILPASSNSNRTDLSSSSNKRNSHISKEALRRSTLEPVDTSPRFAPTLNQRAHSRTRTSSNLPVTRFRKPSNSSNGNRSARRTPKNRKSSSIFLKFSLLVVFFSFSLDDLKITVENKTKQNGNGRANLFKQHTHQPKPSKASAQEQDATTNLRISVNVPERKDVKTASKEQTRERAVQKAAAARTEERAQQLQERRVISGTEPSAAKTAPISLSERWGTPKAVVPAPAPGTRVVYMTK